MVEKQMKGDHMNVVIINNEEMNLQTKVLHCY